MQGCLSVCQQGVYEVTRVREGTGTEYSVAVKRIKP